VHVRLAGLPNEEQLGIERAIKDYFECGCMPARCAAIVVIACTLLAFVVTDETISWNVLVIVGLIVLLVPLAAMLISIVGARRRLWRTLDSFVNRTNSLHPR
jgi:hypothetical protein